MAPSGDILFADWQTRYAVRTRQVTRRRWIITVVITAAQALFLLLLSLIALRYQAQTKGDAREVNQPVQVTLVSPPAPPRLLDPGSLTQPTLSKAEMFPAPKIVAPLTPVENPPLVVPRPKKIARKTPEKRRVKSTETRKTLLPPAENPTAPPASQAQTLRQDLKSAQASSGAKDNWIGRVYARLKAFRQYPLEEKEAGIEGKAQIWFAFDRSGHVVASGLLHTSGNDNLDAAAVSLPKKAEPIPLPPEPDRLAYPYRMTILIGYAIRTP